MYGMNSFVGTIDGPVGVGSPDQYWQRPFVKGSNDVPMLMDAAWLGGFPDHSDILSANVMDESLPYGPGASGPGLGMSRYSVNRHMGHINVAFLDFSVRPVNFEEIWKLKWHQDYDVSFVIDNISNLPEWMTP